MGIKRCLIEDNRHGGTLLAECPLPAFFCATGVDVGRIYGLDAFNEAL